MSSKLRYGIGFRRRERELVGTDVARFLAEAGKVEELLPEAFS